MLRYGFRCVSGLVLSLNSRGWGMSSAHRWMELVRGLGMGSSWKQAVFVGGAILILAACSDATAPERPASLRTVPADAALRAKKRNAGTDLLVRTQDCRSGYSVSVGFSADSADVGVCLLR